MPGPRIFQRPIKIKTGKPIDILSLKSDVLKDFKGQVSRVRRGRQGLFKAPGTITVDRCPVCRAQSAKSVFRLEVYGGRYHQCGRCGHVFIINRPSRESLERFYSHDKVYASTYTDKGSLDARIEGVVKPKLKWALDAFKALYGREPRSILDVGAGGGHFVHVCRQAGLTASGIELSEASLEFCRHNFKFDMESADFIKDWERFSTAEMITFWGVIEHVPDPLALLRAAHRALKGRKGLIIVEVPRWESLSTIVQRLYPDSIIRHLDPLGHINCFTDNSLNVALQRAKFSPVEAWYFGMDVYELMVQIAHDSRTRDIFKKCAHAINELQEHVDRAKFSDDIAIAAKPAK